MGGAVGGLGTVALVVVGTFATSAVEASPVATGDAGRPASVTVPAPPPAPRAEAATTGVRLPTVSRASSSRVAVSAPGLIRAERTRARALVQLDKQAGRRTDELVADQRARALAEREEREERRAEELAADQWTLPVVGYQITARFGQSSYLWSTVHTGVDLAAPTGTRVGSVAAGVVTSSGYDGSYGNKVVVTHPDSTQTWYAHLNSISVSAGQQLTAGEQLGTVGSTGNSTGPHLHLEVRPSGLGPVDPLGELENRGLVLE